MERRIRGSKVLETLLVVCSASTGEELLRAPLGDPCDYQELDAVLDTTSRTLTVTVNLKPGQDPSESDAESMRTATSELDPAVDLRIGTQTPAPAAASSVPTTPLQSDEGETMNSEDSHADGAAAAGEAEDDGQATKKKKKKKNKKKKKATATGSEAAEVEADAADGSDDGDNKANADSAIHAAQPASETLDHPAQEDKEKENQEASEGIAAATVAPMETEVELLPPAAPATFELGKEVPHRPLSGPHIKDALSKDGAKDKREDKWLVKPFNAWSIDSQAGEASFGAWGIFDGHGGRQVATYASNSLLKFVAEGAAASPQLSSSAGPPAGSPELPLPEVRGLAPEDAAEWMAQAELVRRLPTALKSAFAQCNAEAQRRFKEGGTTATLAVSCGWELLVANVGDSCAYLDTGAEVLAVTTTHRLQDSPAEVARIEASGGEVARSTVDGVPAGPIRVWPGGLAMARSIGDVDAGERVTAEPEICQVSIPLEGARLIIGSDGLWDAIHPKTAAHHTREMPAAEAAHRLLALAIKKDKLKDDVTVVVVDFLPKVDDRLPPALSKHRATAGKKAAEVPKVAHVWHPLQPGELGDHLAAGAARRQAVLDEAAAEEEAQRAEEARRKELKVRAAEEAASRAVRSGPAAVSGLYAELAHLTLTPADIEAALAKETKKMHKQQQQLKEGEDSWFGTVISCGSCGRAPCLSNNASHVILSLTSCRGPVRRVAHCVRGQE